MAITTPEPDAHPALTASRALDGLDGLDDRAWSSLGQLGRALRVRDADLNGTLLAVLTAAVGLIDGAHAAGLNLIEKGQFVPQAVLGGAPPVLDAMQQRTGVGPCIDASREQRTIAVLDTRHEDRWPSFADQAVDLDILSMLCVPLWVDDQRLGSLSLYARTPRAFDGTATKLADLYATHAALALADAQRTAQLHRVVASRDLIGQAKGVLMATRGLSADDAFALLLVTSQHLNRKVVDIAEALTITGELPSTRTDSGARSARRGR